MCVKDGLMRIHPWLAALSSACLLMAAGENSARAQQPAGAVYESGGFGDALEGRVRLTSAASEEQPASQVRSQSPGVGFQPPYGSQDPGVLWPPGAPPQTFNPYPQISPYYPPNISRDETYNRNGLWFREMLHRDRDYFMTLEYLMVRYRDPGNAWVGARPVPVLLANPIAPTGGGGGTGAAGTVAGGLVGVTVYNYGLGGPAQFGIFTGGTFQRVSVGPGVFPFPFVFESTAQVARNSVLDETLFPIHTLGVIQDHIKSDGMRARWGYFNEDDSGLMLTGWFGAEGGDRFQRGRDRYNGIFVDQAFILNNSPTGGSGFVFPRNGALPLTTRPDFLDTGGDPLTELTALGFTGITTKFDVLYQLDVSSFAAGGALHWYHEPVYKRKWVTVRPTFGARYQYLDERFVFRGIDSGLGYDLDFGTAGGAQNQIITFRPDAASLFPVLDDAGNGFFFEANLNSQIDSHMAGPEAGIRYDFGSSKHFGIWGQSTFALLANHERINITGRNIGDPVNYWLVTGDNWADPTDGIDTSFKVTETHTHASPMFEQSVFIDMDVFQYIPYLNKMHMLSNARFRTGYTYTVIGSVARPGNVIDWRAFPDLPRIDGADRKTWHTHNWSFAVDWTF
jgi:hypothetical protein